MYIKFPHLFTGLNKLFVTAILLGCALTPHLANAQTCQPIPLSGPAGTWGPASPDPAPYGPYNGCDITDGRTTVTNFPNDHGFYTEYDGTPTWTWTRTVTDLDPNQTYQVYYHLETENTYHTRHVTFNYNLAGDTGSYTTGGDPSGSSIGKIKTFNVTGVTSLTFTGTLHCDAYQGCNQAQELRFNLAVMKTGYLSVPAPITTTFLAQNNVCPSQKMDLTALVSSTCETGSTLEWHTSATASAANIVANPASVVSGEYYAFCHKTAANCYSPASAAVYAIPKTCEPLPTLPPDKSCAPNPVPPQNAVWGPASPGQPSSGPFNNCWNLNGNTYYTTNDNDHGFYTEYDGTSPINWSRTVSNLNPTKTYEIRGHFEAVNIGNPRNMTFDYNLGGNTGSYTTSAQPKDVVYTITGVSSITFTGSFVAAAYNNCDAAKEMRFNLGLMELSSTGNAAPSVTTSLIRNNVCPALNMNLTGLVTSNCQLGSVLEWHTANVAGPSNLVANPYSVPAGIYFAFCHKIFGGDCYSAPSVPVFAIPIQCENTLVPDVITFPITQGLGFGNMATNDKLYPFSTFGTPVPTGGAPYTGIQLIVNQDGSYYFTATKPGTYTYDVPVCMPGVTTDCPTEKLTIIITGTSNRAANNTAISSNTEYAYVYPNPVVGNTFTFIYDNNAITHAQLSLQMTDLSGRVVYKAVEKITSGSNKIQVQTNHLSKGIYYLSYNNPELKISGVLKVTVNE